MGFHVSWLAVLGTAPSAVRTALGLSETTGREDIPESDVTGVLLPSGWYLVFFNDPTPAELAGATLATLSQQASLMSFIVDEGAMISQACGYAEGRCVWQVSHDAQQGLEHLEVKGTPPAICLAIKHGLFEKLTTSADNVDYLFDLPAALSQAITGFRHDEDIEGIDDAAFVVLERT